MHSPSAMAGRLSSSSKRRWEAPTPFIRSEKKLERPAVLNPT